MSDEFVAPSVEDDDILWACRLLGMPDNAFHGADGADPRAAVIKETATVDIAACPGSGKTTLLVAKLAILANKWQYPTRGICVLSHTNVARNEIELLLGGCPEGQSLLRYPHYIGTIHGFVNEFLALPWLRSLGYPIKIIDSSIVADKRWRALAWATRNYLENLNYNPFDLVATQPDFSVADVSIGGDKKLSRQNAKYQDMCKVCKESAAGGYFSHSEMFMWARHFLEMHPRMIQVLRDRFPMVFIDESQDNDDEQAAMLYRLFCEGASPVRCQRYGDANQAIFNNSETETPTANEYVFPLTAIKRDLPNSHRFNQRIASLADPLGLVPYKLKGEGPKKALASKAPDAQHTIFLFTDKAGAERVLAQFGDLLFSTFSDEELRQGTFKAVGQVTKKRADEKFPAHVGHYWPSYDHDFSKAEPRPASFAGYILIGVERSQRTGLTYACVQKLAEGVLELVSQVNVTLSLQKRTNRHEQVCELLEGDPKLLDKYKELVGLISLERSCTKKLWDDIHRQTIQSVAEYISGKPLSPEVVKLLDWPLGGVVAGGGQVKEAPHPNLYRHQVGEREASIQIGSIHSVKGETHTGTLVFETFYYAFNIDSIKAWLLGMKIGAKTGKSVKLVNSRLKLHYVAMTRPSHLLCLALQRSAFETSDVLDRAKVAQLEAMGWTVREV